MNLFGGSPTLAIFAITFFSLKYTIMIPGPPKLVICPFCGAMKELMTLANNMEKCSEVLSSISTVEMTDFEKNVYVGIKERMKKGDTRVFIINEE